MTFAEILLFIGAAAVISYLLKPLQKRLEAILYRFFRSKNKEPGEVIDITDSIKKDKPK